MYKVPNKNNLYYISITQDLNYPNLIDEHVVALETLIKSKVSIIKKDSYVIIRSYSNMINLLFPKYGVGYKHLNKVYLPQILLDNIDYKHLVKGLFQSDGSYYKRGEYFHYGFTNISSDIAEIYTMCLDNLNIHYTKRIKPDTGAFQIDIATKENVIKFRDMVGIKT